MEQADPWKGKPGAAVIRLLSQDLDTRSWSEDMKVPSGPFGITCDDDTDVDALVEAVPTGAKVMQLLLNSVSLDASQLSDGRVRTLRDVC